VAYSWRLAPTMASTARILSCWNGASTGLVCSSRRARTADTFTKLLQSQRSATMVNAPSCPNGQVVQMSRAGGGVAAVVDFASHSYMAKWGHHMG